MPFDLNQFTGFRFGGGAEFMPTGLAHLGSEIFSFGTGGGGEAIAGTLTNPPLGSRLGVLDNPTARPFINHFKQARRWESNQGGLNWLDLRADGHITETGSILSVPSGGDQGIRTYALEGLAPESGASGRWRFRWDGPGTWTLHGAAQEQEAIGSNEIRFTYAANGSNNVPIIARSATGEMSNFRLSHEDDWADEEAGHIFRRQFLDEIRNNRTLRFDEWMGILRHENDGGLRVTDWASRARPADEMFYRWVPYEWQAALCNEVGADGWFCLPTACTDDHIEGAAALIESLMPAPRLAWVEYSTKTWDFAGTAQAHYCANEGAALFNRATGAEFLNFYGMRTAIMAQICREVWGNNPRMKLVVQTQCDWIGNEYDILVAPMWQEAANPASPYYVDSVPPYVPPYTLLDMLTVHAQVDGGMAYGTVTGNAGTVDGWVSGMSQTAFFNQMRDQMLDGRYIENTDINQRNLLRLRPKWDHYRDVCDLRGLMLGCYELGNHLNGVSASPATHTAIGLYSASAQMGTIYSTTVSEVLAAGFDGPICFSVDCRQPDSNIAHGAQRWLGDHNAAWAALNAIQAGNNGPAGRGASDFVGAYEQA